MKFPLPPRALSSPWLWTGAALLACLSPDFLHAAGNAPQPSICTRGCWGARAPKSSLTQMSALTRAIVHHTAGNEFNTTSFEDSKANVRAIQNLHMDTNGWADIGYHFLVDKFGYKFEGRSGSMSGLPRGAHDGTNTNSFGFNCMGYFHPSVNNVPTAAMMNALYDLIAWRMPGGWQPYGSPGTYGPLGNYVGYVDSHRRVKATACPGDHIHNPYVGNDVNAGTIRAEIKKRIDGFPVVYLQDFALYEFTNVGSNLSIDVPNGSLSEGVQMQQWYINGSAAQLWQAIPVGGGWYKFRAQCSGHMMDCLYGSGPEIIQVAENGASAQEFQIQEVSSNPYQYRIQSRSSGKFVEIGGGADGSVAGDKVIVWDWNGGNWQKWYVTYVPFRSGPHELVNVYSLKEMDVPYASPDAGVKMWQWTPNGGNAQRMDLQHTGRGWYRIRPLCTSKVLDVVYGSADNGTELMTWDDTGGAPQRFAFIGAGGGKWKMICQSWNGANKAIEIAGWSTDPGGKVVVWDYHGGDNQHWYLHASPFDEGDYDIICAQNGMALDASCSLDAGTQMKIWDRLGNACQSFHLKPLGDGKYSIRANYSGLMLDVDSCNAANGTALKQWNDLANECQRFRFLTNNPSREGNWFIRNSSTRTCVDNTGGSSSNGNLITMWGLDRWSANQRWLVYRR